ncbi:MAG: iron uptake porin [Thermosynechococcaceae cyanobacterium MS004]|nr:iron uptake porin [Thermosynechococcaceae cyanobacterium MS004]
MSTAFLAGTLTSVSAKATEQLQTEGSQKDFLAEAHSASAEIGSMPNTPPHLAQAIDGKTTLKTGIGAKELFIGVVDVLKADQKEIGQVTSVSQLSDVQPTDWAFQALQSLVERYGCIAGYPDSTFRGNRAATRYELAAALNACLDQISDRFATKEDLATVKALQEEFKAELATLKGRVDGLEARTKTLEAQQFSTTTKLSGLAVFTAQYGDTIGSKAFVNSVPGGSNLTGSRATALAAVQLSFNTSFSGSDLLQTTLFVGNNGQDLFSAANVGSTNSNPGPQSFFVPGQYYWSQYPTSVGLYRLSYNFKPTKDLSITVGPLFYPTDIIDLNSYTGPVTGFSSYFFINNPLITPYELNFKGGAGAAVDWKIGGGPLSFRAVYVAASPFNSTSNNFGGGLFGDPYQGTAELEYANKFGKDGKNSFAVRLQYTNSATSNISQNAGGINAELNLGRFGLFGRYGISGANAYGGASPIPYTVGSAGDFVAQTWMVGAGVKDLLIPGSLLAAAGGQPFINDLGSAPGINDRTQTNLEAFYRFPINDNISVSPTVMAIINPNNSSVNPTLIQGLIRVTFSF